MRKACQPQPSVRSNSSRPRCLAGRTVLSAGLEVDACPGEPLGRDPGSPSIAAPTEISVARLPGDQRREPVPFGCVRAGEGRVYDRRVAPGDVQSAFAQAAAEDGIVLGRRSFDWLCEQGHVGLERVAKARRDPSLAGPVIAAVEPLAAIYARLKGDVSVLHASRENLLLPVELFHEPTGHRDRGRRPGSLHLVPPHRARALPGRCGARLRPGRPQGAVPRPGGHYRRPRPRPAAKGSASAVSSASARTATRCSTSRRRRWAIRRWSGSPPRRRRRGRLPPPPNVIAETVWLRRSVFGDGDVHRLAAPALHAHLERHLDRLHRLGEQVAALHADVVVGPVAWKAGRSRPPGSPCRRRSAPPGDVSAAW